jgi:hypothetical protein
MTSARVAGLVGPTLTLLTVSEATEHYRAEVRP